MYLSKDKNFGFIAVPRTGSHSFQKALYDGLVANPAIDTSNDIYISTEDIKDRKKIGDFPLDVDQLQSFLGLDRAFPRKGMFGPDLRYYVMLHHVTPANMVKGGLLTVEDFDTIDLFGFVRDPISRWMSHTFLSSKVTKDLVEGQEVEYVIDFIRVKLKNHRFPPMVAPYMQDYFYYEDRLVATPYTMDKILDVYNDIMIEFGGQVLTELPIVQPLDATIPDNCKGPIETWLPEDCVADLLDRLAPDIEFYNKVINNELTLP